MAVFDLHGPISGLPGPIYGRPGPYIWPSRTMYPGTRTWPSWTMYPGTRGTLYGRPGGTWRYLEDPVFIGSGRRSSWVAVMAVLAMTVLDPTSSRNRLKYGPIWPNMALYGPILHLVIGSWTLYLGPWDPIFRVPPWFMYQGYPIFRYTVPLRRKSLLTSRCMLVYIGRRRSVQGVPTRALPTRRYLPGPIWTYQALYGPY